MQIAEGEKQAVSTDAQHELMSTLLCFSLVSSKSRNTIFNIFFELIQHSEKSNPTFRINQFNMFRTNVEVVYYVC